MTPLHPPAATTSRLSAFANKHRKYVLAGPATFFIACMLIIPLGFTVYLSMTGASGSVSRNADFIGLANYLEVLTSNDRFWPAVGRTFAFTAVVLAVEMLAGLGVALLLWRTFRGDSIIRVIILLPLVATPVAVGMMWMLIFHPTIGAANEILSWIGVSAQGWLSDPRQALPTLMFIDIWQWTPMVALILLAGLRSISDEPLEAAAVDGANSFQRLIHVILPTLAPTLITALLLRAIDALKTFDIIYATKGKGGGSYHEAETLNILAYSYSFDYQYYGKASAVLVLFLIIILAICAVLIIMRKGRKA
ncbi:MAG: sugar ABC transporter permease [Propionibacteriaceae bacterium]|jgi:multiple sugar transport system permease protein|nr:sugar ABC transporter permease [Propionibacteriaceae bacterium]